MFHLLEDNVQLQNDIKVLPLHTKQDFTEYIFWNKKTLRIGNLLSTLQAKNKIEEQLTCLNDVPTETQGTNTHKMYCPVLKMLRKPPHAHWGQLCGKKNPNVCDMCSYKSKRRYDLQVHTKNVHNRVKLVLVQKGILKLKECKDIKCHLCSKRNKAYKNKNLLHAHVKQDCYKNERKICSMCGWLPV